MNSETSAPGPPPLWERGHLLCIYDSTLEPAIFSCGYLQKATKTGYVLSAIDDLGRFQGVTVGRRDQVWAVSSGGDYTLNLQSFVSEVLPCRDDDDLEGEFATDLGTAATSRELVELVDSCGTEIFGRVVAVSEDSLLIDEVSKFGEPLGLTALLTDSVQRIVLRGPRHIAIGGRLSTGPSPVDTLDCNSAIRSLLQLGVSSGRICSISTGRCGVTHEHFGVVLNAEDSHVAIYGLSTDGPTGDLTLIFPQDITKATLLGRPARTRLAQRRKRRDAYLGLYFAPDTVVHNLAASGAHVTIQTTVGSRHEGLILTTGEGRVRLRAEDEKSASGDVTEFSAALILSVSVIV